MIPIQHHAQARCPSGSVLELSQRGDAWFLSVDRTVRRTTEWERLDEVAVVEICGPLAPKRQPRVLIEGIGLGIAARKAIQVLPPRGRVTVAERVPELIQWQRRYFEPVVASPPEHFQILKQPLGEVLAASTDTYDAILLELDYAVDPFLRSSPRPGDYRAALTSLRSALRERGQLAIHCGEKDLPLLKALRSAGFEVEERLEAPHKRSKGRKHSLIFARLPAR